MRGLAIVLAVLALILAGCGRVPIATLPSPDASASPAASPVAAVTPSATASASTGRPTPTSTPRATPTSSRPLPSVAPSPTFAPLVISAATFHAGEVRIGYADVVLSATGGKSPYTWSIGTGALPDGLALSGSTVGGTPTLAGSFSFSVAVKDARGVSASKTASIDVASLLSVAGRCSSSPCSVEAGCTTVCGSLGSQSGGVGPFTYTPLGSLPTGMGLSGLALTGAFPAGSWKFGVGVTDALGATASLAAAFDVFPHIALADGTCSQKAGSGLTCVIQMDYTGGTGKPAAVGINPKTPGPKGTTAVLSGGVVIVTVPAQALPTSGKLQIIITDSAVCGPSAGQRCTDTATASYAFL